MVLQLTKRNLNLDIVVNNYDAKAVKVLHRIELGSTLKIKGKEVRGYLIFIFI